MTHPHYRKTISLKDKPTIGLLLCCSKIDIKASFALRSFTQPLGISEYETQKLFAEVASSFPQIEDLDNELDQCDHEP